MTPRRTLRPPPRTLRALAPLAAAAALASHAAPARAQGTPARPIAILTNGNLDGAADRMDRVIARLRAIGAEIIVSPYNHLRAGGCQNQSSRDDDLYLSQVSALLDPMPEGRPVFLIGHSFGGDSVLKAARRVTRSIDLVAALDPVAAFGRRITSDYSNGAEYPYVIPSTVGVLFNRWQTHDDPPWNFLDSGRIADCDAGTCDQEESVYYRDASGAFVRDRCAWWEYCPDGTKRRPMDHGGVPQDAFTQTQINALIDARLANRRALALRNVHRNQYLVAEGAGGPGQVVNANRSAVGAWERFALVDLNGGGLASGDVVHLASDAGYLLGLGPTEFAGWVRDPSGYAVATYRARVLADRRVATSTERFTVERPGAALGDPIGPTDTIRLRAHTGWSLVAYSDGTVYASGGLRVAGSDAWVQVPQVPVESPAPAMCPDGTPP